MLFYIIEHVEVTQCGACTKVIHPHTPTTFIKNYNNIMVHMHVEYGIIFALDVYLHPHNVVGI